MPTLFISAPVGQAGEPTIQYKTKLMDTKQFRIIVKRHFKGVDFSFVKFTARSAPGSEQRIFVIVSQNGTWRILIDNVPGEGKSLGMAKNAVKRNAKLLAA